jgi:predicted dehydrogenase
LGVDVLAMGQRRLRFGVVGLGKMGLLHASLLNVFPDVELVALCEKSSLLRRLFRKVFAGTGVSIVDEIEKLRELNLDAIYVTTPISSHSFIIKSLYSKGIAHNVFTEKTLALDYSQSEELCALCKDFGGVNMVGYMKRFSLVFGKAKELLSGGDLGEPTVFKAYAYSSDFVAAAKKSNSSASRGGALSDLGCHVIDLALWIFGRLEVRDVLSVVRDESGSETSVCFNARNSNGLEGQFDISQSMAGYRMPEFGLSIECPKGKIDVNDDRLVLTLDGAAKQRWFRHNLDDGVDFSLGDPEYFREDAEFVNALLNDRPCESSFDDAAVVDYLISEARKRYS